MKSIIKLLKKCSTVLVLAFICVLTAGAVLVMAEETGDSAVASNKIEIKEIDYDNLTMTIYPNGNNSVYYSDSKKKTWTKIEGDVNTAGNYVLDISWISASKNYEMNLKGDVGGDEVITSVTLPMAVKTIKVKFDRLNEQLTVTGTGEAAKLEWKKAAAYTDWEEINLVNGKAGSSNIFAEFMVKGAKLQVRIPQVKGTSAENPGSRPSKIVQVSVAKRPNAPSIKVNITKLTLNTTTAMEYRIYSVAGNVKTDAVFADCTKNMKIEEIAGEALYSESNTSPKEVIVAIRKKAKGNSSYSKTAYVTIPAQSAAPKLPVTSATETVFSFSLADASKTNAYQYAVVKAGSTSTGLSWKSVTSDKVISFKSKQYPAGSVVYIRMKGTALSKKSPLVLPSAMAKIELKYAASSSNTTQ